MEEKKISWLAGIIEGEGCFCMCKGGICHFFNLTISIGNTDLLILNECKLIIDEITQGNSKLRNNKSGRNRNMYHLVVEGQIILKRLIETILPYIIGEKKAQAELMLQFINRRIIIKGNKKKSPTYTDEDKKYLEAMKALKSTTISVETERSLSFNKDKVTVRPNRIFEGLETNRNDLSLLN